MNIIYYTDKDNNYYINSNNDYYIKSISKKSLKTFLYINNKFKQVKPIIIKTTNNTSLTSNETTNNVREYIRYKAFKY